ncbi:tetratricopeptide repeat protein [Streptomyces sp. JNUCC 64]
MLQHLIAQDEALRMVPVDRARLSTAVARIREEFVTLAEGADAAGARSLARWTGIGLLALGDYDDALRFLRRSLELASASGNSRAVVANELNLGDAYRYVGQAHTAEALYRRALDSARDRHPDLVDFALQHLGKHLMEQGGLTSARAHFQEALRLRTAKGDTALIESTQAALDRVEQLISHASAEGGAEAAR